MCKKGKKFNFNYSKYGKCPVWTSPFLKEKQFWGIHTVENRIVIDVKRYKKECKEYEMDEFIPEKFNNLQEKFYTPTKVKKYDYTINLFQDILNDFSKNWIIEYKPIFKKIMTPNDVYEKSRVNSLMYTTCSDDIDEINLEASMDAIKREEKYKDIIKILYCQFISYLAVEIDRILIIIINVIDKETDFFKFSMFKEFSNKLQKNNSVQVKIEDLEGYDSLDKIHRINNFIKHNSLSSYNELKNSYPNLIASVENNTANFEYKSGMYAINWLIIPENFIDTEIEKLKSFLNCFVNFS